MTEQAETYAYNGNGAAEERQRDAAQGWDNHVRGLIHDEHEFMLQIVARAVAELRREVKAELAKAMREAALEALPNASAERERVAKAIADSVDKLRDEIRAETKTNLRVAILEQGGLVPRVRGTWSEHEAYAALDICMFDGVCWIAKHSSPGVLPGDGWQLLSCKGERGKPGPIGPRGEEGPQGLRGEMGPSGVQGPKIIGWQVDRQRFVATPIMSGGQPGPELELRGLFEEFQSQTS